MQIELKQYNEFFESALQSDCDIDTVEGLESFKKHCEEQLEDDSVKADYHCTRFYQYNIEVVDFLIKCKSNEGQRLVVGLV